VQTHSSSHDATAHDASAHDATGSTTDWTGVCEVDRLEPLWGEAALVEDVQVALVLLPDGSLFAVSNQDPATGSFVMSRGIVGSRGARPTLASPLHKQVYDLGTGECFTSAEYSLRTYPVRVVDGVVQVSVRRRADLPAEHRDALAGVAA
jgi:nitrite reductase (NADH) small subunit